MIEPQAVYIVRTWQDWAVEIAAGAMVTGLWITEWLLMRELRRARLSAERQTKDVTGALSMGMILNLLAAIAQAVGLKVYADSQKKSQD